MLLAWHFQAPELHVTACLSSKVKELQAPRWTLLWSTMSGGVASFLPFTYYVYEWKLIRVPLHPHNGLVLASNIIKPSILGVIILASYTIHMYTMYDWLLVSNNIVCSHPSWNEDNFFCFKDESFKESKEFNAFDAGRIIISMSVATKLFNERCRWENVCIPYWRNEDCSLGQKSFVKWFFDNRKSDWTMWKPTCSNHCMFFSAKQLQNNMNIMKQTLRPSSSFHHFSPCRSTTAVPGSGRAHLRPPFFLAKPSKREIGIAWSGRFRLLVLSHCAHFFSAYVLWAQS